MSDHDPSYWAKLAALLHRIGEERRVFVDGGANRGDFTASLLQEFPGCFVHAVEANPRLAAQLGRRFDGGPVRVWGAALHDQGGSVELQIHADDATSSILPRPSSGRRYFHSADRVLETVAVPAVSLDALAREAGIERIHLLKLDTQGAELAILRGARGLLEAAAIDVLYTEFFIVPHYEGAALLPQLWALLERHGYVLYDLFKGPCGSNGQLRFGDAIFVSPRVRERCLDDFPPED